MKSCGNWKISKKTTESRKKWAFLAESQKQTPYYPSLNCKLEYVVCIWTIHVYHSGENDSPPSSTSAKILRLILRLLFHTLP